MQPFMNSLLISEHSLSIFLPKVLKGNSTKWVFGTPAIGVRERVLFSNMRTEFYSYLVIDNLEKYLCDQDYSIIHK